MKNFEFSKLKSKVQEFLDKEIPLYINGQYQTASSNTSFDVLDPSTGKQIAIASEANENDVNLAAQAARNAFDNGEWTQMPAQERSNILYEFARLLKEHREELAELESIDSGKVYETALADDIDGTIQQFEYYAGFATQISGKTTQISNDLVAYTLHEPIGVVGQIIPWNFPLLMASWKLGAALAVGCTIVIKPAMETPLSLLYAAQLFKEAGFPDGVVNIIPGPGRTVGEALTNHTDVDKLAFTGSTAVGTGVMKNAAEQIKNVTLELGGKSPAIVLNDADLDETIEGVYNGTMYNHGQNCSACTRVYVQRDIYDDVIEKLKARAATAQVGPSMDPNSDMGPLISERQQQRVLEYIDKGKQEGAKLLCGGNKVHDAGYYVEPTIFVDVEDDMTIAREEIFGPVMAVFVFDEVDEVINRANDSEYGLASSVWTQNIKTGHYISNKLKAGTVWINTVGQELETMPFGGYKQSGIGREMGGEYGIQSYTEVKSVMINID